MDRYKIRQLVKSYTVEMKLPVGDNLDLFFYASDISEHFRYAIKDFDFMQLPDEVKIFYAKQYTKYEVSGVSNIEISISGELITASCDMSYLKLKATKENICQKINELVNDYDGWTIQHIVKAIFEPIESTSGSNTYCFIFSDFCVLASKDKQKAAYAEHGLFGLEIIYKSSTSKNYSWYFVPRYCEVEYDQFHILERLIDADALNYNLTMSIDTLRYMVLSNSKVDHPFWQMFLRQIDILEAADIESDITWDLRPCNVLMDADGNYLPYDIIFI